MAPVRPRAKRCSGVFQAITARKRNLDGSLCRTETGFTEHEALLRPLSEPVRGSISQNYKSQILLLIPIYSHEMDSVDRTDRVHEAITHRKGTEIRIASRSINPPSDSTSTPAVHCSDSREFVHNERNRGKGRYNGSRFPESVDDPGVDDAAFLSGGTTRLRTVLRRRGHRFRYEKTTPRNAPDVSLKRYIRVPLVIEWFRSGNPPIAERGSGPPPYDAA